MAGRRLFDEFCSKFWFNLNLHIVINFMLQGTLLSGGTELLQVLVIYFTFFPKLKHSVTGVKS